jgi:hypothetical protein
VASPGAAVAPGGGVAGVDSGGGVGGGVAAADGTARGEPATRATAIAEAARIVAGQDFAFTPEPSSVWDDRTSRAAAPSLGVVLRALL